MKLIRYKEDWDDKEITMVINREGKKYKVDFEFKEVNKGGVFPSSETKLLAWPKKNIPEGLILDKKDPESGAELLELEDELRSDLKLVREQKDAKLRERSKHPFLNNKDSK